MGMTSFWTKWGQQYPVSVIQIDRCQVLQVKTKEKDGRDAIQVGSGQVNNPNAWRKPQIGHFAKAKVPPKRHIKEFHVTQENHLPLGWMIGPSHFRVGQYIDVKGTSKGKGTQGVMKRWNFKGQFASHGNSKAHRKPGSIGQCEYPGRVFKGKKMAGKMGAEPITTYALRVLKIDTERSLLYVGGSLPGHNKGLLQLRDSIKKVDRQYLTLHYPGYLPPKDGSYVGVEALPDPEIDSEETYWHENTGVVGPDTGED